MLDYEGNGTYTVATFHSHTNGLPPNGQDVAELCNIGKPQLENVYVITGSGSSRTAYTLHVENRDALVSCRNRIQVDESTNHFTPDSEAGHHYNEAMARFEGSAYSAEERHAYALVYALERCGREDDAFLDARYYLCTFADEPSNAAVCSATCSPCSSLSSRSAASLSAADTP